MRFFCGLAGFLCERGQLHFDLEKPVYTTGVHTGAGIQIKISDNIELYKANLADTFNMFDTAIINGTTSRRLIINAKDSLLDKVTTDGLWVKGIMPEDDNDKSDKIWYTGVNAVRLPMSILSKGSAKVDTAFSFGGKEKMASGDVVGKVVGGGEKSIIKMSTITTNENYLFDTLSNVSDPGLLMHGESRVIECDTSYYGSGNELMFLMQGPDSIQNRILVEQNGNKVIVHDTSQGSYNGKFKILYNNKVVFVADVNFKATSLGFVEAVNGVAVGIGSSTVPATFRISNTKVLSDAEGAKGNVIVRWTPGLKILNERGGIIWPDKVDIGYIERTWSEYKEEILANSQIQIIPKCGEENMVLFSFIKKNTSEKTSYAKALLAINSIGFVDNKPDQAKSPYQDDREDSDNYFLRTNNDHRGLQIFYNIEPTFLAVEDVKIRIFKENSSSIFMTIPGKKDAKGNFQKGKSIDVTWDAAEIDGSIANVGFYRIQLEVKIKGYSQTLKTEIDDADNRMPGWQCPQTCLAVHDLIWKHRPRVFVHAGNDINGSNSDYPIHPDDFIAESGLLLKDNNPGGILISDPATPDAMLLNSTQNNYLDLKNGNGLDNQVTNRALLTNTPTVLFSTNTEDSRSHIFLQFWFFSSWSSAVTAPDVAHHEGDIEYCQIAITKKDQRYRDENEGELKRDWVAPLAVFASQHYYGQTLSWDRVTENDVPSNHRVQTVVTHIENRPNVFIARGTHATYFCGDADSSEERKFFAAQSWCKIYQS
ncbi:MAG: hypothetical protein GX639_17765 [Fibrobacter sp.]|nr:hypothetical protein [Fibrobacter sp.]